MRLPRPFAWVPSGLLASWLPSLLPAPRIPRPTACTPYRATPQRPKGSSSTSSNTGSSALVRPLITRLAGSLPQSHAHAIPPSLHNQLRLYYYYYYCSNPVSSLELSLFDHLGSRAAKVRSASPDHSCRASASPLQNTPPCDRGQSSPVETCIQLARTTCYNPFSQFLKVQSTFRNSNSSVVSHKLKSEPLRLFLVGC